MERVNLIAVKSLKYGGTRYEPGKPFSANRRDGKILTHIKRAKYAPAAPVAAPVTTAMEAATNFETAFANVAASVASDGVSAHYETAALTPGPDVPSGSLSEPVHEAAPESEPQAAEPMTTKRTYRRRDMTAKR